MVSTKWSPETKSEMYGNLVYERQDTINNWRMNNKKLFIYIKSI